MEALKATLVALIEAQLNLYPQDPASTEPRPERVFIGRARDAVNDLTID